MSMTAPFKITTDRDALTAKVIERVKAHGPHVFSDLFISVWCGSERPTEALIEALAKEGVSISPHGFSEWRVEVGAETQEGLFV